MKSSTNTLNCLVLSSDSTATVSTFRPENPIPVVKRPWRDKKATENAIYGYIRAVRALGRTEVNTIEIADALSLSIAAVDQALVSLRKKGVKPLNA